MHIIYKIVALLAFVANLFGCDHVHRSLTEHVSADGRDVLYSVVEISAKDARFKCIASQSGACHYTLFAHPCDTSRPCETAPLRQFSVPSGQAQAVRGLPHDVQPCVSQDGHPMDARCQEPTPRA